MEAYSFQLRFISSSQMTLASDKLKKKKKLASTVTRSELELALPSSSVLKQIFFLIVLLRGFFNFNLEWLNGIYSH